MKVNNVSENAKWFDWMVIRFVDGELWFWGSWIRFEDAVKYAAEVGGAAVPTNMVLKEAQA